MEKIKEFIQKLKEDVKLRNKVIICAVAAVVLVALIIVLCVSCGSNQGPSSDPAGSTGSSETTTPAGDITYTVVVKDALGNPYGNNVIVNFVSGGNVTAMQPLNEQGVAEKVLAGGDYTVELTFTDTSVAYYYDTENAKVAADNNSIEIVLSLAADGEAKSLSAYSAAIDGHKDYNAYNVGVGCTYVTLDPTDRNYFIFVPKQDGVYEFSVVGGEAQIGYYGGTFFVQSYNLAEMTDDGKFSIDVAPGMINTEGDSSALVIGVDSSNTDCIISIQRTGDHVLTIEDYPWEIYASTSAPSAFTLPEGTKLVNFDITAASDAYKLVYNEADGFYHLDTAAGPLVYVKLGEPSEYLDSFETILESSPIVRYNFDEEGAFVSKTSYTECMMEYIACMDEATGVYPLTEDLKYIIQQRGEYVGWWDSESAGFLFSDDNDLPIAGLNTDIAWLFACCYGDIEEVDEPDDPKEDDPKEDDPKEDDPKEDDPKQDDPKQDDPKEDDPKEDDPKQDDPKEDDPKEDDPSKDDPPVQTPVKEVGTATNEDEPIELGGEGAMDFTATVNPGEFVCYNLYKVSGTTLKIKAEYVYVIYNDKTYWPSDGVISIELTAEGPSVPISLGIGNWGISVADFSVKLSYPKGSYSNPEKLSLGSFTTTTEKGNNQGYYYTYTAESSGTFTITFKSINISKSCQIALYNLNTFEYQVIEDGSISVTVNKGDEVQITIGVVDPKYEYPAATIKATATLD